jgi:hypothetical protein
LPADGRFARARQTHKKTVHLKIWNVCAPDGDVAVTVIVAAVQLS